MFCTYFFCCLAYCCGHHQVLYKYIKYLCCVAAFTMMCMCIFIHTKNKHHSLHVQQAQSAMSANKALLLYVFVPLYSSVCVFVSLTALTVWSVSGGRTMVFSMVFITSFHSSFNTRFNTVFSQILANKVRLAGGGDRRQEGEMNNKQQKEANTVFLKEKKMMIKRTGDLTKKKRWLLEIPVCHKKGLSEKAHKLTFWGISLLLLLA